MLKFRIMTAIVLLPFVILGTLFSSTSSFAIGVGVIVTLAAWEWSALAKIRNTFSRLLFAACFPVAGYFLYTLPSLGVYHSYYVYVMALFWFALAIFIMTDPVRRLSAMSAPAYRLLAIILGALLLLALWISFVGIHQQQGGPGLLLSMFVLIWAADTGAYFAGRKWGSHKLAPRVSPGKTWEGVAGGLSLAMLAAMLTPYILELEIIETPLFMLVAAVTVMISVSGDLFESVFKRVAAVKDSGRILPGHGGILDRIDSLVAAGPVFLAGLMLLGNPV